MVLVTLDYAAGDNCDPTPSCTLSVASNEPVDGSGDGHSAPDWDVLDARHVSLRAERSGQGHGRVYTLTVSCTDSAGGTTQGTTTVEVPHSAR